MPSTTPQENRRIENLSDRARRWRNNMSSLLDDAEALIVEADANDVLTTVEAAIANPEDYVSSNRDAPTKAQFLAVLRAAGSYAVLAGQISATYYQDLFGAAPLDADGIRTALNSWV